ncbi:unnamed protein product [Mytilus edulis]|uniref:Uncharacterized protein n=1 Tax=Mytilus edulis TaxID=6550 RepID=A0A8S3RXC6_MYTED|nr:unnamed protein product [Mytilus edulis]
MVSGTSDSHAKKSSRRKLLDISTTETEKDKSSAKNTKKQQKIVQSKSPSKNSSVKNKKISLEHERHSKKDSSKPGLEHDISDSDQSVEREIHSIAQQHAKSSMDEMSDFSIASPKKKRKLRIVEAKTTADSSDENSGDEASVMSQSILSTSTSGNQLKGSSEVHKKKRKSHTMGDIESDPEDVTNQQEQHLNLRYNLPEGYELSKLAESSKDVCKEDLRHKDLWLIKAPVNVCPEIVVIALKYLHVKFDIQNFNGMEIDLNGCTEFSSKDDELYGCTEDTKMR